MVCKHFNLDAEYIQEDLRWDRWVCYLAVALDLDEIEDYKAFIFAGGEGKKFKWSSSDHGGLRPHGDIGKEMIREFGGANSKPSDVWQYGKIRGLKSVTKAFKWEQQPDGGHKMIGEVWVDENGVEVDTTGFIVVESTGGEAKAFARSVAERLQ